MTAKDCYYQHLAEFYSAILNQDRDLWSILKRLAASFNTIYKSIFKALNKLERKYNEVVFSDLSVLWKPFPSKLAQGLSIILTNQGKSSGFLI